MPLPIKSTQERTSELRLQFPVSSGQLHRKTENEWVPVAPKKPEAPKPVEAPQEVKEMPVATPGPQIFPIQNTDDVSCLRVVGKCSNNNYYYRLMWISVQLFHNG